MARSGLDYKRAHSRDLSISATWRERASMEQASRETKLAHDNSPSKQGSSLKQWRVISELVGEKESGIKPCLTFLLVQNLWN